MNALGLLGGTFDPVHYGHLRLAIEIREAAALAEVRLLPARIPNLRGAPGATPAQREAMLELAVTGTGLTVDARELAGTGVTYTIDTLVAVRAEIGTRPLCFILGQDAFNSLPRWHRWHELLDFAHLVVATRPGYDAPDDAPLRALLEAHRLAAPGDLHRRPAGGILLQPIPLLPIAATELRARIRAGRNITGLTPAGVADYIRLHQLYRG